LKSLLRHYAHNEEQQLDNVKTNINAAKVAVDQ
jgi:hypothetical protein